MVTTATRPVEELAARYPFKGHNSVMTCPQHHMTVSVDGDGRINSKCPACLAEAVRALLTMRKLHP